MTIQPLTPEERADLNAWIAEHVYKLPVDREHEWSFGPVVYDEASRSWFIIDDYCGDWAHAGPLFDRYSFSLYNMGDRYSVYRRDTGFMIAIGTTGPEAIAKAVKVYEEGEP